MIVRVNLPVTNIVKQRYIGDILKSGDKLVREVPWVTPVIQEQ